ncbi:YutD family protein [uncultured Limosilactobacillus sp.]|uniref:YutD family protein n=1 Tax=uncultured Limosilactobacillus sp. TaxID=2837629 RepID=UPI0025EBA533|nr:YutD family protein [uncultured Limosilactobacillus sp.]
MNRAKIQDYIDQRIMERKGTFHSAMVDSTHFIINKHSYAIVEDNHQSFDLERFTDRFSMILSKYDYILGDWGYDQLRLRGFYDKENPLYRPERGIETLQDYLYEQCNFGCDYFVLKNEEVNVPRRKKRRRRGRGHHQRPFHEKREKLTSPNLKNRHHQEVKSVQQRGKRHFVIKKRSEG